MKRDAAKGSDVMLKRATSVILAVLICFGTLTVNVCAAFAGTLSGDGIKYIESAGYGYETATGGNGYQTRYVVDGSGHRVKLSSDRVTRESAQDSVFIPSSYDLRDSGRVTSVRDQGDGGTCWSFGTVSACESNLITQGLADNTLDLSEDHMTWFTGKRGWLTGDGINFNGDNDEYDGAYIAGGYWANPVATLASWSGTALESEYLYAPYNLNANGHYDETERFVSNYHLQNVSLLANSDEESRQRGDIIKQSIIDLGAVTVSFNCDNASFNETTGAYFQDESNLSNHEISVVGWDDDYPVSRFVPGSAPSDKGAWLCKNSWSDTSGDGGYLWLSYYDTSICEIASFEMESADNYDTVYQHDGYMLWLDNLAFTDVKTGSFANVFTATGSESLEAVGFYNVQDDIGYTVKIFTDVSDGNPESGTAQGILASGTIDYAGYHTVKLDTPVSLTCGQRYSVVVTLTANDPDAEVVCIPFEGSAWYWDNYISYVYYTSHKSESYVYYPVENSWLDGSSTAIRQGNTAILLNNAGLKAYTSYNEGSTSPESVSFQTKSYTVNYKDSFQITAPVVSPASATNKGLFWGSSDILVADVDENGNGYARSKGTATIYVESADGGHYDTCTVNVKYSFWQWLIVIFLFGWIWY